MSLSLFFASSLKAGTSFSASSCTCLSGRKGLFQSYPSSLCSDQAGSFACPTPRVFRACKEHANLASYILHSPSLRGLLLSYLLIKNKDLGFKFIDGSFISFTCDNTSRRAFRLASYLNCKSGPVQPKAQGRSVLSLTRRSKPRLARKFLVHRSFRTLARTFSSRGDDCTRGGEGLEDKKEDRKATRS